MRVHERFTWTCHPDSKAGDLALLYRANDPFQDFSHVYRMEGDPGYYPDLAADFGSDTGCDCELVAALQVKVRLNEIRADATLSQWQAAKVNFHGTSFPLGVEEWEAFLRLGDPLDCGHLRSL
jgi:hypothetical protein